MLMFTKINNKTFKNKISNKNIRVFYKSTLSLLANCFPKLSSTFAKTATERRIISLSVHCCKCSTIF